MLRTLDTAQCKMLRGKELGGRDKVMGGRDTDAKWHNMTCQHGVLGLDEADILVRVWTIDERR